MNNFIELFSDAAATPDTRFIQNLEKKFLSTATMQSSRFRLSGKQKLFIAITIAAIVAIVALLIFLPRRNMSDPSTNSLVEEVVAVTKQTETLNTQPVQSQDSSSNENSNDTATNLESTAQPTNTEQDAPPANPSAPSGPVAIGGFLASYWNLDLDSAVAPSIPAGAPYATSTVENIDFDWGNGSPLSGVQSDGFIVRFTKESNEMSGQYKVEYASDNGLRMHVGETVVFDYWNSASSSGTAYFTTDPATPVTAITIDYYENDGPANVYVVITKVE